MNLVMSLIQRKRNVTLYLPESFEWILLKSNILNDSEIKQMLTNPCDFIESKDYFSWEQFFTDFLIKKTNGTYLQYSKKKLNENYLAEAVIKKITESDDIKK